MEWFSITWVFGIITLACGVFFLQMVVDFNGQRSQIMPALKEVRGIKKRHETEIEKVGRLTTDAETQLTLLEDDVRELTANIKAVEEKLDAYRQADSDVG